MASGILVHGPRVSKKELELWTLEMGLVIWVLSEMDSHMKESIIGVTVGSQIPTRMSLVIGLIVKSSNLRGQILKVAMKSGFFHDVHYK